MSKYKVGGLLAIAIGGLFLSGCTDIERRELKIIVITDQVISDGGSVNNDFKALLAPIEPPNTDLNHGYIPEMKVIRADVARENTVDLDVSTFRDKLGLNSDFEYASGTRKHVLSELKAFEIESKASNGILLNLDSLINKDYPEALQYRFQNEETDAENYFDNIDSLTAAIRVEIFKKGFDNKRPIVIRYKTKSQKSSVEPLLAPAVELNASFEDCYRLKWNNSDPMVNYMVSWANFKQRLGNTDEFVIPERFRNKKMDVVLCAYTNEYDSVIACDQISKNACPRSQINNSPTSSQNAPIEPIGDMGLRIANGVITWEQKNGYEYEFVFERGGKYHYEAKLNPIKVPSIGRVNLSKDDLRIINYIKVNIPYVFKLQAYRLDGRSGKRALIACYALPAVTVRSIGQGSNSGFIDSYCERLRVNNIRCE